MTTPPQPPNRDDHSPSNRSRSSSNIIPKSASFLHRTHNGRIERARSASSLLSTRNRPSAVWEAAIERNRQSNPNTDQLLETQQSLPEYIAPLSLAVSPSLPAASTESNLPTLEAIPTFDETSGIVGGSASLAEIEVNREVLRYATVLLIPLPGSNSLASSMEFMMPPQYPPHHFGAYGSSYQTGTLVSIRRCLGNDFTNIQAQDT
jgi:hypothetical protein